MCWGARLHGYGHNKSLLGKHFCIWPDLSLFLVPNELQGARARKHRGRERSRNGIQLNWPEEGTAAKIEGLVTNSASVLIAIQSSLLYAERRLNLMKEKQTCYRLLNKKGELWLEREILRISSPQSHPLFMHSCHPSLSYSAPLLFFIRLWDKERGILFEINQYGPYQTCFYNSTSCEIMSLALSSV